MTRYPRHRLLALLTECDGDEIWSVAHCQERQVPALWIEELSDAYESSFDRDDQTIYDESGRTNQYHGVRDVDLAMRIARELGIQVRSGDEARYGRARLVQAIKDAVMGGDDEL